MLLLARKNLPGRLLLRRVRPVVRTPEQPAVDRPEAEGLHAGPGLRSVAAPVAVRVGHRVVVRADSVNVVVLAVRQEAGRVPDPVVVAVLPVQVPGARRQAVVRQPNPVLPARELRSMQLLNPVAGSLLRVVLLHAGAAHRPIAVAPVRVVRVAVIRVVRVAAIRAAPAAVAVASNATANKSFFPRHKDARRLRPKAQRSRLKLR